MKVLEKIFCRHNYIYTHLAHSPSVPYDEGEYNTYGLECQKCGKRKIKIIKREDQSVTSKFLRGEL